jgi:hypothetical protein
MFAMLLVSVFVCKFFVNIGDFFAELDQDDWFATALVTVIIILAAYKFAGDIPSFIDNLLGTKWFADSKPRNLIGGLFGLGLGALAGFAGGIAGGSVMGGIRGLASGAFRGAAGGSKGNTIADLFKNGVGETYKKQKSGVEAHLAKKAAIAEKGGRFQTFLGRVETATGAGRRLDRHVSSIDEQSSKLDAYSEASARAIKDAKTDSGALYKLENDQVVSTGQTAASVYSAGYETIKLGEDKDAYASQMIAFNRNFQAQEAEYERIKGTAGATQAEIETARQNVERARTEARSIAESHYDAVKKDAETGGAAYTAAANQGKISEEQRTEFVNNASDTARNYRRAAGMKKGQSINVKTEKQRLFTQRGKYTNQRTYARTHGQNPNKK